MNWKIICITFLLLCICFRVHYEYIFPFNLDDRPAQLGYAQSLLKGYGIGSIRADEQDLSKTIFTVSGNFAPAYPIFVAPLLYFTANPFIADWLLKIVIIIVFFYALYGIFSLLSKEVSIWAFILLCCFWAVSPSPFRFFLSTDFHSLAFYFLSIYLFLKIISKYNSYSHQTRITNAILLGISCFMCSFFRFSYYPFSFLIPFFWVLLSTISYKELKKYSFICLLTTSLLIICQLFYQHQISAINFVNNRYADKLANNSELYWANLAHFNIFTWASFFHASFFNIRQYLDKSISFSPNWYESEIYAKIIFTIVVVYLIIKGFTAFLKLKNSHSTNYFILYLLGLFTILLNVSFIASLSIYYPPENTLNTFWNHTEPFFWTFASEARYFAPSVIFIQIFIFSMPFLKINNLKINLFARFTCLCIIGSSLFYSWTIWYYPMRWGVNSYSTYKDNVMAFQLFIYEELPKIAKQSQTVVSSDASLYQGIAAAAGYKVIDFDVLMKKINTNTLHTSKPIKIVIFKHYNKTDDKLQNLYQQYIIEKRVTYFERLPMKKKEIEVLLFDALPR